jgi:hypothetical protein
VRLECASCGQLFVDREMFDAIGSCFSCGGSEVRETEECEVCGAAFPRGRSCPVCAGTRASAPAETAAPAPSGEELDIDSFLARIRAEPVKAPPLRDYRRPPRAPRAPAADPGREKPPERVLPPTRIAVPVRDSLLSRDERLPTPELIRLLHDEGRWIAA